MPKYFNMSGMPPKKKDELPPVKLKKQTKQEIIRDLLLANPEMTIRELQHQTKISKRTIMYARDSLIKDGLLPPSRQNILETLPEEGKITQYTELLDGKSLSDLAGEAEFEEEIADDVMIQKKLMKEVRTIAFNPVNHPDVRLSAIQIWAKLKDLEKQKDIGPGPPRSESEIIERMTRLMKGVGPNICLKSLEIAFPKGNSNEKAQIDEIETISGA